ncbi:hypothetical protein TeGR_g2518 [Tetraparma gracilis]|uniref:Uncharacterized protein n=1 Tax=Tetraparma gracilis TaxID=2962635 RepID=A0ABQ6MIG7_9STRA|nr:hypothetical protein TeGR_g2518 [Tetraparma gracilis]
MKFSIALAALMVAGSSASLLKSPSYYEGKFEAWMKEHSIEISKEEYDVRLGHFSELDDRIELHNAKNMTYTLGHNEYSHMSWEEFREAKNIGSPMPEKPHLLGLSRDESNKHTADGPPAFADHWWCFADWMPFCGDSPSDNDDIDMTSDWVEKGGVTDVKDQGSCGSCWSFSTTGAVEGAYFLKTGSLVAFSEQQLVDCDIDGDDAGCNGGLMDNAFKWIKSNGGLCKEDDYAYKAKQGTCQTTCEEVDGSAVSAWVDVQQSDKAMESALDQQPVSIAIEADQRDFQSYSGGVLTASCGTNLDHGVLAVGYGTMKFEGADDIDYYRVKNSWGPSWGKDGYIYLERGVSQSGGQCGMLMAASYPVL